ncbi:PREDICTED: uncharacterized protein LOC105524019 [Colobus angolensis palliatus]|uniref:uncharacterized protein LOC105524019 n=1 Tax=Colobus angolensis palliatus TaxID=336983 RepID=UPI0005F3C471|nr:PREDICTED: uncharacterized protein LOC105524019 [Colobus angolensis palliatus]
MADGQWEPPPAGLWPMGALSWGWWGRCCSGLRCPLGRRQPEASVVGRQRGRTPRDGGLWGEDRSLGAVHVSAGRACSSRELAPEEARGCSALPSAPRCLKRTHIRHQSRDDLGRKAEGDLKHRGEGDEKTQQKISEDWKECCHQQEKEKTEMRFPFGASRGSTAISTP